MGIFFTYNGLHSEPLSLQEIEQAVGVTSNLYQTMHAPASQEGPRWALCIWLSGFSCPLASSCCLVGTEQRADCGVAKGSLFSKEARRWAAWHSLFPRLQRGGRV